MKYRAFAKAKPNRLLHGGFKLWRSSEFSLRHDAEHCLAGFLDGCGDAVGKSGVVEVREKPLWRLVWSPEGKEIAAVNAATERQAKRKAPMPYRKYLGEIYAERVY